MIGRSTVQQFAANADAVRALDCHLHSPSGTLRRCRSTLRMSTIRGRPEVNCARSK
jgi:hypothetical protein